jgi:hypothetical protein
MTRCGGELKERVYIPRGGMSNDNDKQPKDGTGNGSRDPPASGGNLPIPVSVPRLEGRFFPRPEPDMEQGPIGSLSST